MGSAMLCLVFSHDRLFATPRTVACQAPLSMGFSRQEYWSGLPCPSPGDQTKPRSPAWQADSLPAELLGKPFTVYMYIKLLLPVFFLIQTFHSYFTCLFIFGHTARHMGSQFPKQELNPCPLHWKHAILTTGPLKKSHFVYLNILQFYQSIVCQYS